MQTMRKKKIIKNSKNISKKTSIKKVKVLAKSVSAKKISPKPIKVTMRPMMTQIPAPKSQVQSAKPSEPVRSSSVRHLKFIKDIAAWTFVIVAVFGVLSVISQFESGAPVQNLSLNDSPKTSVLSVGNNESVATVLAVGEISLARYIEQKMRGNNDYTLPFANVSSFLNDADITVGAFSNPILSGAITPNDSQILRTDPRSIEGLLYAGFDLLAVANNQVMNFQDPGLMQTLSALNSSNIKTIGAGENLNQAHTPAVFNVNGKSIAFYAYVDPSISPNRRDGAQPDSPGLAIMNSSVQQDVKNALTKADFVIVMMHAGVEYKKEPTQFQRDFAHAAIDAGASVVIGTHPHVVQEIENYGNGIIFYSLGNFLFDQYFSDAVRTGLTVKLSFSKKGTKPEFELIPVRADSYQPYIPDDSKRGDFLKLLGL